MKLKEVISELKPLVAELKEGPVYVLFIETSLGSASAEEVKEMFAPADVRIVEVDDMDRIKLCELSRSLK